MAWNQMWRTRAPGTKDLLAVQVCGLLLHHLPNLASFTFIDLTLVQAVEAPFLL